MANETHRSWNNGYNTGLEHGKSLGQLDYLGKQIDKDFTELHRMLEQSCNFPACPITRKADSEFCDIHDEAEQEFWNEMMQADQHKYETNKSLYM